MKDKRPRRNEPCPCGSGKKYKKCCIDKDEKKLRSRLSINQRNRYF